MTGLPRRSALLLPFAVPLAPAPAVAQAAFPSRPIRILVGFQPGGSTDIMARLLQPQLSGLWNQPVVVENRAGASGLLATEAAIRAPADGHTVAMIISTHATAPALMPRMAFDPVRDITPIAFLARLNFILVVPASSPYRTLQDLLSDARAKPGQLAFGSTGLGGSNHLAGELLKRRAGVDLLHVPYRGGGPSNAAVVAGETAMLFGTWPTVLPLVRGGQLRALAHTAPQPAEALPGVPAMAEIFPGFEAFEWYGFVGPAGLPSAIVTAWRDGIARSAAEPSVAERLASLGVEVAVGTPAEFGALIGAEIAKYGPLIRELGLRAE
jgi:tripartite-type tricarboxylate transporter receptor subunit TctC